MRYTVSWQPKTQHSRPALDRPLPTAYSVHRRPNKKSSCSTTDRRHSVIGRYTVKGTQGGGGKAAREGYIHRYIKTQAKELETRGGGRKVSRKRKKREREKKNWAATK